MADSLMYASGAAFVETTATAEDILNRKTAFDSDGKLLVGSIPGNGDWTATLLPGEAVTVPEGCHSGKGKVMANWKLGIYDTSGTVIADKSVWTTLPILIDPIAKECLEIVDNKLIFKKSPGYIYLSFVGKFVYAKSYSYWIISKNGQTIASRTGNGDSDFSWSGFIQIADGDVLCIQGRPENNYPSPWTCKLVLPG